MDFSKAKILIVGDIILDHYIFGNSQRISPEAPVPIVNIDKEEHRLGGAANVAINARKLGANISLLGIVGDDKEASTITELLQRENITFKPSVSKDSHTIKKSRIISNNQQISRLDYEKPFSKEDSKQLFENFKEIIKDFDLVVFSDYAKGSITDIQPFIACANQLGVKSLIDPKGDDFNKYKDAFCLKPNEKEFRNIVDNINNENEFAQRMVELSNRLNLKALVVTRGANGINYLLNGKVYDRIPTVAQSVYDVSGAGDTVLAVLACMLANQKNSTVKNEVTYFQSAITLANKAAGIAVSKQGTSTIYREELFQKSKTPINKYIQSIDNLLDILKSNNGTIAFTNGCFDILHTGHIHCLEKASSFADILIVAVNSDSSIKRLKGYNRPINSLLDRLKVLNALECITWLIDFGDDRKDKDKPLNLIRSIKPNVLIKGGDYQTSEIVGADIVQSYGGQVKTVELQTGYSTTNTILHINNTQ